MGRAEFKSIDELPDLTQDTEIVTPKLKKTVVYKSIDELPDLKKKVTSNVSAKPLESGLSGTPKVEKSNEPIPYDEKIFTGGVAIEKQKAPELSAFKDSNEWRTKMIDHVERESIATGKIPSVRDYMGQPMVNNNLFADNTKVVPRERRNTLEQFSNQNKQKAEGNKKLYDEAIENTAKKVIEQRVKHIEKKKEGEEVNPFDFISMNMEKKRLRDALEKGELAFGMDKEGKPGLKQTIGFWENVSKKLNDAKEANVWAEKFKDATPDEKVWMLEEQNQRLNENPEYIGVKESPAASVGGVIAEQLPFMGKAIGGGLLGGLTMGLPTMGAFLATSKDAVNIGATDEIIRRFEYLKKQNPNGDNVELMKQADNGYWMGAASGLATNAILTGTSLKVPLSLSGKTVLGKAISKTIASGVLMGGATAGIEGAKLAEGNLEGIDATGEDIAKSMAKTFVEQGTLGSALHIVMSGVPKVLKSAAKFALKDAKPEDIAAVLKMNEDAGTIPPGTAEKVQAELANYKKASEKTIEGLPPEVEASVTGLIEAKMNLEAEAKTKDSSLKEHYDSKIEAIDNQIKKIIQTGKPYAYELNQVGEKYTAPEGITVQPPMTVPEPITVSGEFKVPKGIEVQEPMKVPEPVTIGEKNIPVEEAKTETTEPIPETKIIPDEEIKTTEPTIKEAEGGETKEVVSEPVEEAGGGKEPPRDKDFDKMTANIPNSGDVKKYLSGETILENQPGTELRNPQEYEATQLNKALSHGVETIEKAKEIYGDEYVEKTLDYIDKNNLPLENKALLYVSLENEMAKRVLAEPDNAGLKKLEDLVRAKSQAFLSSASKSINMGRLRAFAKTGFDITKVTDKFFSPKEREQKKEVEELLQADADTIQKQYEENLSSKVTDADIEAKVKEGVESEIAKLYEKLPKEKKTAADKAIAALDKIHGKLRSKTYESTIGIPVAIIDAGVVTIRAAIKAGVKVADAIEMGIAKIKEKYGKEWLNEGEFRKDVREGLEVKKDEKTNKERLATAKEAAQKRIDKVREEIINKERELKEKQKPLSEDLELQRLKEIEKSITELRDKYLPEEKDPYEVERQRERVKDKLVKDIIDLNDQINAGERNRIPDKPNYENDAEISKLRKIKENKTAILNEIDPLSVPKEKTISEKVSDAESNVQKRIDDIRQEIINGEREVKESKGDKIKSKKLEQLREQKKSLEALRDKYLPKNKDPYENEKALKASKVKVTKDIIELNRQINKGEKDVKEGKSSPESIGLDKLKDERDARKEILEALDPTPKEYVKNALIEQGFGKTIKVKTKTGVEERQVLDWKKLAGEEGSLDKISENVEKSLEKSGFSEEQLNRIQGDFIKEYNNIRKDVIEKGLNEIAARNKTTVTPDQKSAAKKLAEMYNYGLFDKDLAGYETVLAKTIGIDKLNTQNLSKAIELGKSIANLFESRFQGKKLTESQMRSAIQVIEDKMRYILHNEAQQHGSTPLMLADMARTYMDLAQRMTLNSIKQAAENPLSGKMESFFSDIGYGKEATPQLNKQAKKLGKNIYKEMVLEKGTNYGDVSSTFVNKGNIEMELDKISDNRLVQGITSTFIGRTTLDAVDSAYKAKITQQKFTYNLIKILQQDRVVNGKLEKGMSKEDARNYVSEKLTGQSFKDAQATAKEIIDRVNKDAGQKIFNDSPLFVDRLANDIVTAALVNGEKISADMVTAAYNAAYKAAGRGLGHVANNTISKGIGNISGQLESSINEALKKKEYNKAAGLTAASIFFRNIANPFVGGGTNWVVLKAEKSGLGLLSGLGSMMTKGRKMDLTNEAGMKELENAMYQSMKIKDKLIRGAVGGAATAAGAMIMAGVTTTDEYRKWRLKNMWAAKYLDLVTPEIILATMAKQSGKSKRYLEQLFNKNEAFNKETQAIKAVGAFIEGDENASALTGQLIGSSIGAAAPWRLIRDGQQLWQGATGGEPYKIDSHKPETFWQAYFKGGMLDYIGVAPKSTGAASGAKPSNKPKQPKKPKKQKEYSGN